MSLFYSASVGGFLDDQIHQDIPSDARPISADTHRELIAATATGCVIAVDEHGDPQAIPAPPPSEAEQLRQLRTRRDQLLRQCDFTQMPDYPLSEAERDAWAAYRQALRDLPQTVSDPLAVEWPAPPSN